MTLHIMWEEEDIYVCISSPFCNVNASTHIYTYLINISESFNVFYIF